MTWFRSYIRKIGSDIFIYSITIFLFYFSFKVADLPMEYFIMDFQIVSFILLIYMIIAAIRFKKEIGRIEEIESLKLEKRALKNQMMREKDDLEEYFAVWVHQIKTPITVSRLLLDELGDEDRNLYFKKSLKKELHHIEEYTNMAMSYLKILNRGADMDLTEVNLDDVIRSVLKKYSLIFISNHTSIDFRPSDKMIVSDYAWLSILLEQVVSNAAKYTEHGQVSFIFHEDEFSLEVRDTGIGIRSEDIPKIFERGYSGFNGRLNQKSSGLGLFLASSIARRLSIGLRVESRLGEGTSFYMDFPKVSERLTMTRAWKKA